MPSSSTVKRTTNGGLATAMALLIQNQAEYVSHIRETQEEFARIKHEFDQIKPILLRHEQILTELPEVIRQKVGFRAPQ